MPIDVTPTPRHPHSFPPVAYRPGWSMMPSPGPARMIDILPPRPNMPGSIAPNGLRNPYAPYAGEGYIPSSTNALAMHSQLGSSIIGGSIGGSMIVPSVSGAGYREDEGWNGCVDRNHLGHNPDMSSVGVIGPTPSMGVNGSQAGWLPASWGNHRRMTPTIAAELAPSPANLSGGGGYHQSQPMSVRWRDQEDCGQCNRRSRSHSHSDADHGQGHRYRRSSNAGMANSPLRKVPILPTNRSSVDRRTCSLCS
ncbi:uncharacterized protein IL334_000193 [Kwoniella shivajii]|uniref:C2H2-type domain-containing protein n=1 Tax=Kwoniella shivajii TaxID=564305 RepID=A0ABZ1CPY7_9TREE|nr:hypothetical protein IL334_000193 [Kwoniella shivajii]